MIDARLRLAIEAAADAVDASRDELCRIDAVAGDGDHGVTMTLAARAVRGVLAETPDDAEPADLLTRLAVAVGSVGGAIGPLWATGLLGVATTLRARPAALGPLTVADARRCAEAAEAGIASLGGAKPGDKTVLDAVDPLVAALRDAEASGADLGPALQAAAAAAAAGAAATVDMVATVGRASRLGERGRGSPDPGATSFSIVSEALVRSWAGPGQESIER
jgi:dihydroxyacetone kinase